MRFSANLPAPRATFLALLAALASCVVDDNADYPEKEATNALASAVLQPGEQLGVNYYTLSFGREAHGTDSIVGTGLRYHGVGENAGRSLRFFDGAVSQKSGAYDIAYKNTIGAAEKISATFPNAVPGYGSPLKGGGAFDGSALWLGHSRFKAGASPQPPSESPPTKGTLWNGELGPADRGTDVRAEDERLIEIDVKQNQLTQRSFLISAEVYAPTHAGARTNLRPQPYVARRAGPSQWGLTAPGGLGNQQIDLASVLNQWALLQVRADISTQGGSLPDPSDDSGQVTYRYFLNGAHVGDAVTLPFDPSAMQTAGHTGPVVFSPAFMLLRGWQGDAPEVFLDNLSVDEILRQSGADFAITSPANGSTVTGSTPLRVALGSAGSRIASVEYALGGHRLGLEWSAPHATTWNSAYIDDGPVRLTATARDAVGNVVASAVRDFIVQNDGNRLEFIGTAPNLDAPLSGPLKLNLRVTDSLYTPVLWVLYVDGRPVLRKDSGAENLLELDTTALSNGTHEIYLEVHSADLSRVPAVFHNNRANLGPRLISVQNVRNPTSPPIEVLLDPMHVYLTPGETKPRTVSCSVRYLDGSTDSCPGATFSSDRAAVTVDSSTGALGRKDVGFANITVTVPGARAPARAYVWSLPDKHVPHFSVSDEETRFPPSYEPGRSLFVVSPFQLGAEMVQDDQTMILLKEVKKAGVNTLSSGIFPNPRDTLKNIEQWKDEYDSKYSKYWTYAKNNKLHLLLIGDDIARRPTLDAWPTLNWLSSQEALGYAFQSAKSSGMLIGVDVVDEITGNWKATLLPNGKAGAPCMFKSIVCNNASPPICTVTWPGYKDACSTSDQDPIVVRGGAALGNDNKFVLLGSSKLANLGGTTYEATRLSDGFQFVGPGNAQNYDSKDDPALEWSFFWRKDHTFAQCGAAVGDYACKPQIPNNTIDQLHKKMHAAMDGVGAQVKLSYPTQGGVGPQTAVNWFGKGSPSDYASHFFDTGEARRTYPWSWSVRESTYWMRDAFYNRQYGMDLTHPQIMIGGFSGIAYTVGATQTPHAKAYDPQVDTLGQPGTSPASIVVNMLSAAAIGNAGVRLYTFENPATWNNRATRAKGDGLQTGANPINSEVDHWRAMAYAANALTKVLAPYLLANFLDSPALGGDIVTAARQGSDGRMLLVANGRDWPQTRTISLENYVYASGAVVRYRIGPHGIDITRLPSGATSDTPTLGIGEGVAYIFYPSAQAANAVVKDYCLPLQLPSGASSAVLRTSYVYPEELTQRTGGGIACSGQCKVPLNPSIGDPFEVFYQYTFLAANGSIVGTGPVSQVRQEQVCPATLAD